MRLILTSIIFFVLPFYSAAQNTFVLNGELDSIKSGDIWLTINHPDFKIQDTSKIINGKFYFKGVLDRPVMAMLDLKDGKRDLINFILEPETKIIKGKGYPLKDWRVKNSKLNTSYLSFLNLNAKNENWQKEIDKIYLNTLEGDSLKRDSLDKVGDLIDIERKTIRKNFIKNNPNNVVSLILIEDYFAKHLNIKLIDSMYNSLSLNVKRSKAGKNLYNIIHQFDDEKMYRFAPEIAQKDTLGNVFKLSSLRGKYVLIDFWASWCIPCREENSNIVAMYKKYKSAGFEILSVSYDSKLEDWKRAIVEDSLNWLHVSELNDWQNSTAKTYKIGLLPQNVLVNPQGKMIAKNLMGEALIKKLEEIF